MHPMEFKKEKVGTGRFSHLILKNSEILVDINFDTNKRLQEILSDDSYETFLLYPGDVTIDLGTDELKNKTTKKSQFIVIDGTWPCAKKMMKLSTSLHDIPRVSFRADRVSEFKVKHQPMPGCLSTVESIHQVLMHIKYLYDTHTGLFYHGWSFNRMDNFGGIFWCRGNSWFTLGILDYVDMFKGTLNAGVKTIIVDTYKAQVRKLKELQSKSGLWHTVLTDPDSYEEVSGSAAIVAGILKGIKMGILDDSYLECAWKGVQAILKNIDKDGTVLNVSGGTGMGYDADHYKNILIAPMAYGQSLTILALVEALQLAE